MKLAFGFLDGVIIKHSKKGNLADCCNWCGITLLAVLSKVFWARFG